MNIVYKLIEHIKANAFDLEEKEKFFVMCALTQAVVSSKDIICSLPTSETYYFLGISDGEKDLLKEKTLQLHRKFSITFKDEKNTTYANLLSGMKLNNQWFILEFDLEHVNEWLKRNESSSKQDELSMDTIDKRRFAKAISEAVACLDRCAGCYRLYEKSYYLETRSFLEEKIKSLK